jgi:hypothetical protein
MSVLYVAIRRTQIVTASRAPRTGRAGDLAVFNGNHGYSFHYLHSNGDINAAVAGHKSDECLIVKFAENMNGFLIRRDLMY